jgi:cytochrome c peroxidase
MPTIVDDHHHRLFFGAHTGEVHRMVPADEAAAATPDAPTPADPTVARSLFGVDFIGPSAGPVSDAVARLGERLFADPRLSATGQVACATCHDQDQYGQDGRKVAAGARRNTPSVWNSHRQFAQFRDYRVTTVEQAVDESLGVHMGFANAEQAAEKIAQISEYRDAFRTAFGDDTAPTTESVRVAIGGFLRRLVTRSRWDEFLDGDDDALTNEELIGVNEFIRAGCTTCHMYRGLGGGMPQRLGLMQPWTGEDKGRGAIDSTPGQEYFFKVPALDNVAVTGPYYHDGSMATLADAVRHMAQVQLLRTLSDAQVAAIVAFLGSLTGERPGFLAN